MDRPLARRKPLPKKRPTPRTRRCSGCGLRLSALRCPDCGTRKATARGSIGKRCDKLWADWIKADGKCAVCGYSRPDLEAAHIIGRAQRVTRWLIDPPNGIPLCHWHHRLFDTYKLDREAVIRAAIGEAAYEQLLMIGMGVWNKEYPLAELTAALAQRRNAA